MPELPEVETIKRGLQKTIVGKTIRSVEVRLPKIIALGFKTVSNQRRVSRSQVRKFQNLLAGQKIKDVRRRAKMLFLDLFGPYTLTIHLKLTGQLIFAKENERKKVKIMNLPTSAALELPHKYTHVIFQFQDGSKLYYNDLRQFGYLRLVRDEELSQIKELSEYGPEPFDKTFSLEYLQEKAKSREALPIKQFLMDPNIVAGIGNIYSDEILYCAKVKPTRKISNLSLAEKKTLYSCILKILREALKRQGSSVGDYLKVDGEEGSYGEFHRVYGRGGEQCRKCGNVIKSVKLGGRTSSYCPYCQR